MKKLLFTLALLFSFNSAAIADTKADKSTVYADVDGLVCDFCARSLEKVFKKQEAVESIKVDLDEKVVTIKFNEGQSIDEETISKMIVDSSYSVREIRYEG